MYSDIVERELFSEKNIKKRIKELGAAISIDYEGKELVMLGILKGAFLFMADLCREIKVKSSFDFMVLSSYSGNTCSSGQVKIIKDLDHSIEGKDVLIVEDIVDNGLTLYYLANYLRGRKPMSLKICTLLNKRAHRKLPVELHYIGFDCPDEFVIGYGLDYGEYYRNIPFIGILKEELIPGNSHKKT